MVEPHSRRISLIRIDVDVAEEQMKRLAHAQAAAVKQQQNELSLRDTSLPLSIIEELPDDDEPMRKA